MITATAPRTVDTIGTAVEASYTIQDSAKIFSILRSNIYSDKMLAVIREYSTNGWDGHILAGTPDRPLKITLPTSLSPVFKVRDFGVGMSEETVLNVYTSYGSSSKDNSNDFNGTFGLGSKSAFAYGNSFDIISFFNGTKTMYTAYLDESNIGKIRKVYSETTTEHNGIEIVVSVKVADINKFVETALNFYKYFNPTPVFINATDTFEDAIERVKSVPVFAEGNGWKLLDGQSAQHMVIMGNVSYPLNTSVLQGQALKVLSGYRWGVRRQYIFEAPIGSVSITASRESLEYDKRTLAWIDAKIDEYISECASGVQKQIDKAGNTVWDIAKLWNAFSDDDVILNRVKLPSIARPHLSSNKIYFQSNVINNWKTTYGCVFNSYSYFNTPRLKTYKVGQIYPANNIKFVFNVKGSVKEKDINAHVRGAYDFYSPKTNDRLEIIRVDFATKADADKFIKDGILKGADIANIQDFPAIRYATSNRSHTISNRGKEMAKAKVFEYQMTSHRANSDNWEVSTQTVEDGKGVYLNISEYQCLGSTLCHNMESVKDLVNMISTAIGGTPEIIHGIRNTAKNIGSDWVHFDDWVVETVKDYIQSNNLEQSVQDYFDLQLATRSQFVRLMLSEEKKSKFCSKQGSYVPVFNIFQVIKETDNDTKLKAMMNQFIDLTDKSKMNVFVIRLINYVGHKRLDIIPKNAFDSKIDAIIAKYPAIERLAETAEFFKSDFDDVIKLVKVMEKCG